MDHSNSLRESEARAEQFNKELSYLEVGTHRLLWAMPWLSDPGGALTRTVACRR